MKRHRRTRQAEQDSLLEAALEEARRRYDAEGVAHDNAISEINIWLTTAAVTLGALSAFTPQIVTKWPHGSGAGFRFLFFIVSVACLFAGAYEVRSYFLGREYTRLGDPAQWHEFCVDGIDRNPAGSLRDFRSKMARAYAEAASLRWSQNRRFTGQCLKAKRWLSVAVLSMVFTTVSHALA